MNLISYLTPILFFLIASFTTILNEGIIFYSLSISICFVFIHILSNELNMKNVKHLLIAVCYLFMLDLSFSFAIGCNVLSFLLASLFFYKIKHIYQDKIKIINYIEYVLLFFTFEHIINFIMRQNFNILIFISQIFFSSCFLIIYKSVEKQKHIEQTSIFDV